MSRNQRVDEYIDALDADARRLAIDLRKLIFAVVPAVQEELKWSRPCYALGKPLCSFVANKNYVSLSFERGAELDDPSGLLEGTGKSMRHVKIPLDRKLPRGLRALLEEAARR